MAQPGEARAAPANARVGTIQRWIVGVAIGCMAIGFTAFFLADLQLHAWRQPAPRPASLSMLYLIEEIFVALACLVFLAGRGVLMYLRPRDMRGQLRVAADRTGHPRFYGVVLIWSAVAFVSALGYIRLQAFQAPLQDNVAVTYAIYGLVLASFVPVLIIETYSWQRHSKRRMQE